MDENQKLPAKEQEYTEPPSLNESAKPGQPTKFSTNQPKDMEVHHHGYHHEKKTWKEYVFDFLMLFLAVFLGFLAENLREKGVERDMEAEYMESLVVDLKNDSAIISNMADQIFEQAKVLETLQQLFSSEMTKGSAEIQACYKLSPALATIYPLYFNERTITQLLSSGSMRLIKKNGAADSILAYYNYTKFAEEQIGLYKYYMNKCAASMYNVYDIDSLKSELTMDEDSIRIKPAAIEGRQFLVPPAAEVKKLKADMELAKGAAFNFGLLLRNTVQKKAIQLIWFLEDKYHIKHQGPPDKEATNKKSSDSPG